jgi:hypothetical protein
MTDFKSEVENNDLHPIVAWEWLHDTYGTDFIDWDPGALWRTISLDFKISLPRNNKACIQALRTLLSNNAIFNQWFVMEKVLNGLNAKVALFDLIQPPMPYEAVFAWEVISHFRSIPELSDELRLYLTAIFVDKGIYRLPTAPIDKFLKKSCENEINNCKMPTPDQVRRITDYLKVKGEDYVRQSRLRTIYTPKASQQPVSGILTV